MSIVRKMVFIGTSTFVLFGMHLFAQVHCGDSSLYDSFRSGSSHRDSVYRRILMEGGKSIDCYLSYRNGSSIVLSSYENNAGELHRLDDFFRTTLSDTLVQIRRITITGYCSIDGMYMRNEELSLARSEGFASYLRYHYPRLSSYPLCVAHVAEDWDGLRKMVSCSSLADKDLILSIINDVGIFEGREKQLMDISGGEPYRELERNYFPLLRRVQVKVECDLQKVIEKYYQIKIAPKDFTVVLERERRRLGISQDSACGASVRDKDMEKRLKFTQRTDRVVYLDGNSSIKQKHMGGRFRPFWAVKTNLLYLAGYSAELKRKYFIPNAELECFVALHWSIAGEWVYGVIDTKGEMAHVWAPSSLSLEPRYWFFDSTGEHHWFYIGVYGLGAQYDELVSDMQDDGHTGSYYEGGLSVGCYIPLGLRLGLELGARLGYRSVDGMSYSYNNQHYYYKNSYTESGLKATGFRVSVSYRFGRQYSSYK